MVKLCIIPEGSLCTLPFELLQSSNPDGPSDEAAISYLFSVDRSGHVEEGLDSAAIFANPSFALTAEFVDDATLHAPMKDNTPVNVMGGGVDSNRFIAGVAAQRDTGELLSADQIMALPWSEAEALAIEHTLNAAGTDATVFEKEWACKESFMLRHDSVLHIATHGFAFDAAAEDREVMAEKWSAYCKIVKDEDSNRNHPELDPSVFGEYAGDPFQRAKDPMMRCGLLLSGAVDALLGKDVPRYVGDGIATGGDIMTLEYSHVKLAVIAACKSGLGEMRNGEGIQGLRKAFDVAGVDNLVCSLWDVDDFSSSILMWLFYRHITYGSRNIGESLGSAKRDLANLSYEEALNYIDFLYESGLEDLASDGEARLRAVNARDSQKKPFADPYHWAGYICIERIRDDEGEAAPH